jgi:hypothetical protein
MIHRAFLLTCFFLIWSWGKLFAGTLMDSMYLQSDYVAIGTVLTSEMIRSENGRYYHSFSARIEQCGKGGNNLTDSLALKPGTILTGLVYDFFRAEPVLVPKERYLLLLQKNSDTTGFQLTWPHYQFSEFINAGGNTPLDYFNRVELLCDTSLKLDPEGSVRTVIVCREGKWTRKIETNSKNIIVADVRRFRKPYPGVGPQKTIYKARFSFDDGRKSARHRRKVKQYGVGTVMITWTFRKDGSRCLRRWTYGTTACW